MNSVEADLRWKCEELRERIRQLEEALAPAVRLPAEWQLTKQEARLFAAMAQRDWVTNEALSQAASTFSQAESPSIVRVLVFRIRKKTRAYGIDIQTVWGEGYRLADRQRWAGQLA